MGKTMTKEEFAEARTREQKRRREERIDYEKSKELDYLAFLRCAAKRMKWMSKRPEA